MGLKASGLMGLERLCVCVCVCWEIANAWKIVCVCVCVRLCRSYCVCAGFALSRPFSTPGAWFPINNTRNPSAIDIHREENNENDPVPITS